jgi:hypothetical protein
MEWGKIFSNEDSCVVETVALIPKLCTAVVEMETNDKNEYRGENKMADIPLIFYNAVKC